MSSEPQIIKSDVFNPTLISDTTGYLTIATGDKRYTRIGTDGYLNSLVSNAFVDSAAYKLSGTTVDLSSITGVVAGTTSASKAWISNASNNISTAGTLTITNATDASSSITGALIVSGGFGLSKALYMGGIAGCSIYGAYNINCQSGVHASTYWVAGTSIGATEFGYIGGITAGTATASKALILDANLASTSYFIAPTTRTIDTFTITNMLWGSNTSRYFSWRQPNSDSIVLGWTGGGTYNDNLVFTNGNPSIMDFKYTMVAETYRNHNITTTSAYVHLAGDGSAYLDGTYSKILIAEGSHASPVKAYLAVSNNTSATATNAVFFGSLSNNDVKIGTGNSSKMTIHYSGYTEITGYYTYNIFTTGDAYSRLIASNLTYTSSAPGNVSTSIGLAVSSNVVINGGNLYVASDRRLKKDIAYDGLIDELANSFMNINACSFNMKSDGDPNVGFIAQELLDENTNFLKYIVDMYPNANMHADENNHSNHSLEGMQLIVDYSHCVPLLQYTLKQLVQRVNDLELKYDNISELEDNIDTLQWAIQELSPDIVEDSSKILEKLNRQITDQDYFKQSVEDQVDSEVHELKQRLFEQEEQITKQNKQIEDCYNVMHQLKQCIIKQDDVINDMRNCMDEHCDMIQELMETKSTVKPTSDNTILAGDIMETQLAEDKTIKKQKKIRNITIKYA
jgi:hypothetical protein